MATEFQVAAAALVVSCCLTVGYGLYLASHAITRVADVAAVSGMMNVM